MKPRFFATSAAFRAWLHTNHTKKAELWIGYYKKSAGRKGMSYQEAVDEALCYGWIDGVVKSIDADSYMQRWTPRKPKSYWSAVNLGKVRRLQAEGRMQASGLAALARKPADSGTRYAFEKRPQAFPPAMVKRFQQLSRAGWAFFQRQPPGYRRLMIHWVTSAKQEATRERRLQQLADASVASKRIQ
jgi:uncharacterized protein YdeI (YjbR/CyaY-like superfamily)